MSELVNKLLEREFSKTLKKPKQSEDEILKEVEQRMKDEIKLAELEKVRKVEDDFISGIQNYEEYKAGVKEGKWKSLKDYARIKLNANKQKS